MEDVILNQEKKSNYKKVQQIKQFTQLHGTMI